MRRQHLTQLFGALIVAAALVALPTVAFAGIADSAHDLSSQSWSTDEATYTGEICAICHTPHNADSTVSDAPLWNHTTSVQVFTVYSSSTLNATDVSSPAGVSMLCLSCHDGTVALDSWGTSPTTAVNMSDVNTDAMFGDDLSNDHPISFTYNTALATADGGGVFDPSSTASGIVADIDDDMLFGAGNDQMECSSCHDVHNDATDVALLRKTNDASVLCLTCHNK
jgi:predicted CXXCH cytochrome family protein